MMDLANENEKNDDRRNTYKWQCQKTWKSVVSIPFGFLEKLDLKIKSGSYYIKRVGDTCFVVETQGQA